MRILKKLPVDQVVNVECDICHQSCKKTHDMEYATLRATWGYDSRKDGEQHECEICEDCYDRIRTFIESLGGHVRVEGKRILWQTPNG